MGVKQKQHDVIASSMRKKTDNNRQTPMYSHVKSKVDTGGSKLRGGKEARNTIHVDKKKVVLEMPRQISS